MNAVTATTAASTHGLEILARKVDTYEAPARKALRFLTSRSKDAEGHA